MDLYDEALAYHRRLLQRVWRYLKDRGISNDLIHKHLLGWDGQRITIPIPDREGKIAFFKLAKDPEDHSDSPKMLSTRGAHAELYGWERVPAKPGQIIICEGEFDRLVLEGQGFPAVTSTGGAGIFRPGWAEELKNIPEVYVCFDRDEAGRNGARRVGRLIPYAKLVQLPEEVGDAGDITDFFVRLGRSREDFLELLKRAQPTPPEDDPQFRGIGQDLERRAATNQIEQLKGTVRIENVVSRYVPLRRSGKNWIGRCLFHDDRVPSFVVFPLTQSFYCFGCRAHGDVVSFLMRTENMTFVESLRTLQGLTD